MLSKCLSGVIYLLGYWKQVILPFLWVLFGDDPRKTGVLPEQHPKKGLSW